MQIIMIEEKIVPAEKVPPAYFDRGIYFGDGVYEVLRSYDGKIFALEQHLQRFARSLAAIQITGIDIDRIRSNVLKAFEAANIANARIYFHITRGSAPRDHCWDTDIKPNFFLTVTELPDGTKLKAEGIPVSTHPDWRWKRCDIKSLNLLANVLALQNAVRKGCDEAILVDEKGLITEGASSSFFAIFANKLQTAPLTANILNSITRQFVIEIAGKIGLQVVQESLRPAQAELADELFITVTTKDIVPVVKFDDSVISHGRPGKFTKLLIKEFRLLTK